MDRHRFLQAGASRLVYLGGWGAAVPHSVRSRFAATPVGATLLEEPWGRIEHLGERVWALISKPLAGGDEARRTFSNGGIVAGRSSVLVIEGFASGAGAQWMAGMARGLTGRPPSHVILTHYHGDHSSRLAAYGASDPRPV